MFILTSMKASKFVTMASKLGMFLTFEKTVTFPKFVVEEAWRKAEIVKIQY